MIHGGLLVWCVVIYIKTRVIWNHFLLIAVQKSLNNAQYYYIWLKWVYAVIEIIFLRSLTAWVWWRTLYKTCGFCLIILFVVIIDVSGYMEIFKENEFVVFWPWWRIEEDYNSAVNDISETFYSMRLGVEVSKLHVWYCIYHFEFFWRWSSQRAVIRTSICLSWEVFCPTMLF